MLDELAQVLGLSKPPRAIESYDISNWGDGSSVCGMVTFRDGKPYKAGYRRFKMKTVAGTDDYASLAETVSRRAAEYEKYAELAKKGESCSNWFGQKPDLLLMDGGRGQVNIALGVLDKLGIQIPDELSVIGFDNLQFARACRPKLTIVSQPTDGIAREVARIMLEHLEKKEKETEEPFMEKLQTEIIEGKSVSFLDKQ